MKVLILKGLPGSGKSTWAKQFVEENSNYVRVNRDDLRNMRGKYWLPKQEDMITDWEFETVRKALANDFNVVLDATNLNEKHINKLKAYIGTYDLKVTYEVKSFDTAPEECIKRDLRRANSVGAEVIWGMYEKYINPTQVYKEDKSLPRCILVDIDGTLAENVSGRSPFDWSRVGEDKVHEHVADIVRLYAVHQTVIIFSGRDSACAETTTDWLKSNEIPFHRLYMRPTGNSEKDSVIKRRLFEDHIRGKYYVDFVLDDRMQVLRMWKSLGLNVLSNNPLAKEF